MNDVVGQRADAVVRGAVAATRSTAWGALASVLLGALIIYGVGFAPGILHGQSHDSRHTLGFICH